MAAPVAAPRRLDGDKARRIIEAMRSSVGERGAAGSTFDHVAREAGVSRGLLHYYFGSKEQLLIEVVRHDCDVRIQAMDERIARAGTVDEIIDALVASLQEFIEGEPGSLAPLGGHPRRAGRAVPALARPPGGVAAGKGARGGGAAAGRARSRRLDAVRAGRRLRNPGGLRPGLGPRGRLRARYSDRAPP